MKVFECITIILLFKLSSILQSLIVYEFGLETTDIKLKSFCYLLSFTVLLCGSGLFIKSWLITHLIKLPFIGSYFEEPLALTRVAEPYLEQHVDYFLDQDVLTNLVVEEIGAVDRAESVRRLGSRQELVASSSKEVVNSDNEDDIDYTQNNRKYESLADAATSLVKHLAYIKKHYPSLRNMVIRTTIKTNVFNRENLPVEILENIRTRKLLFALIKRVLPKSLRIRAGADSSRLNNIVVALTPEQLNALENNFLFKHTRIEELEEYFTTAKNCMSLVLF